MKPLSINAWRVSPWLGLTPSGWSAVLLITAFFFHAPELYSATTPFAWGQNSSSELGDGTSTSRTTPVLITTTGALAGKTVTAIAGGTDHALALTSDGKVYAWGSNFSGQLGNGSNTWQSTAVAVDMTGVLSGKTVTAIACGEYCSLALASDGKLYSWGNALDGMLGNSAIAVSTNVPVAVDMTGVLSGKTVVAISESGTNAMVLTSDNKLYTWGSNTVGGLGIGSTSTLSAVPVAVDMSGVLSGKTIASIACSVHSLVATTDGKVYGWGANPYGAVGDGTTTIRTSPVAVTMTGALSGKFVSSVAVGFYHSMALTSDGLVFTWGYNAQGQLGDGTTTNRSSPVAVSTAGVLSGHTVTAISAGVHSLAITDDQVPVAWGFNGGGQLGNGTFVDSTLPVATDTSGALSGQAITFINASPGCSFALGSPTITTIKPACKFTYAANFGWLNWRINPMAVDAPVIESTMLHGKVYSANVGWINLGNGAPTSPTGQYTQSGGDVGVNHDGAGNLSGYAYGGNIGWIYFDPTISSPPRVNLVTGALSGYAYSANCGWINLDGLCSSLRVGADTNVLAGGGIGNGIPDAWERERSFAAGLGTNLNILGLSANSDFDGDGVSDLDEYLADTNPFDPTSHLRITGFSHNPNTGDIDLDWTGSNRRVYTIYYSSDLVHWNVATPSAVGASAAFNLASPAPRLFFKIQASIPLTQ